MTRVIYVNGRYLPYAQAAVHAEDRGFQFADAIYEVIEIRANALIDPTRHLARLERSLTAIAIAPPMGRAALLHVISETVRRNRVRDGIVYLQITRGAGPRDFKLPDDDVLPTVICLARAQQTSKIEALAATGIAVKSVPEIRWARSDIKTVMLLPAVLAKEAARAGGAKEAWFVDSEGFVTEGASSNAWIVTADGVLVTRQTDARILAGVTRATTVDVVHRSGLHFEERPFTLNDAYSAREAFITSATNTVMPVTKIDGRTIADGRPGPITTALRQNFHHVAERTGC